MLPLGRVFARGKAVLKKIRFNFLSEEEKQKQFLIVLPLKHDLNLGHDFLKFCQVLKGHVNSAIACLSTFFLPEYAIYSLPK